MVRLLDWTKSSALPEWPVNCRRCEWWDGRGLSAATHDSSAARNHARVCARRSYPADATARAEYRRDAEWATGTAHLPRDAVRGSDLSGRRPHVPLSAGEIPATGVYVRSRQGLD